MEKYYGRRLLLAEIEIDIVSRLCKMPAMKDLGDKLQCERCGSMIAKYDNRLPDNSNYCSICINLGRIRSSDFLYYYREIDIFPCEKGILKWEGTLTENQQKVSNQLVENEKNCLVYAVTGAGKTEMIYQLLEKYLEKGKHVCFTSPRVDVCIEIFARFKRDFTNKMKLYYAKGDEYEPSNLVVCTVNQLMRFYQSFDLVIVDEADAFPLVNNPSLHWAIEHARKQTSRIVYLTATPTKELNEQINSGEIIQLKLSKRFHGYPLVLPTFIWCNHILNTIEKGKLPQKIKKRIINQRKTSFPLLIFMPEIRLGIILQKMLQKSLVNERVGFISSQSENRKEISQKFKKGEYTVLIATTVLERGVTFKKVDCFVIASHHQIYTTESLVQIAGRVGRDIERPTGQLLLFHQGRTRAMLKMRQNIIEMNRDD